MLHVVAGGDLTPLPTMSFYCVWMVGTVEQRLVPA